MLRLAAEIVGVGQRSKGARPNVLVHCLLLATVAASFANPAPISGQDDQAPAVPWHERLLVGMEVGPTGAQFGSDRSDVGYAAAFSGTEIVARQLECGSEYLVIWARDGEYAYYNSRIAPKCPGLRDRDVLRETVQAARPHKLPVIAYCVVQANGYAWRQHADWRMIAADGSELGRMCLNSGYLEHIKKLCEEMLSYGIDGFHIDMLDQGFGPPYGCWCPNCKQRFQSEYGHEMPAGVTWDKAWDEMLEFRYDTSARFERQLVTHIKRINPQASVDFNYHGNPPFSWEVGQRPVQHAVTGDFVTGETGVWGFSALGVGMHARFYDAATSGRRFQVAMQRGVRMYHDQTNRPVADLSWELMTLLSHGAFVTIVDKTAYDGKLDPVTYERMREVFEEAKSKRDLFGQPPYPGVGIFFSHRSRDWYGREEPSRYWQSFHGAHQALVYEHLPWSIVLDENMTLAGLQKLPVVLVPNAAVLQDEEVAILRQYVASGGKLVVTGFSGLFDTYGNPQQSGALAELIGGRAERQLDSLDNSVRFSEQNLAEYPSLLKGLRADWWFLVKGPGVIYRPTTATPVGELLRPHRTVRQQRGLEGTDWPMSAGKAVGPAILLNRLGRGQVLTFTCSPDYATASEHRQIEARRLLTSAIRWLWPDPLIQVRAPTNVESVITENRREKQVHVHLIGYLAPPTTTPPKNRPYALPALMEQAPIHLTEIRCRRPIRSVTAANQSSRVRREGDDVVKVLVREIHEAVTIDYE
jgi:hypothetical protein